MSATPPTPAATAPPPTPATPRSATPSVRPSDPRTSSARRRRRLAGAALLTVLGVAAFEWVAAARAYRTTLPSSAWQALAEHLDAAHGADESGTSGLVVLADPWLGPRGRLEIAALREPGSVAPHDLFGVRDLTIIARDGDDVDDDDAPWTPWLREAWGERPLPIADRRDRVGPFVLHHFSLADADEVLFDLVELSEDKPRTIQVRDRFGRCKGKGKGKGKGTKGRWTCTLGTIASAYAEIAYRPRRCLRFEVGDGAQITLKLAGVQLGERLRGHLGFTDFNARIRSDAPALLEVAIDGRPQAALTLSDRQGWAPFEIATVPGRHDLEVTLTPTLTGTWTDRGYDRRPSHLPCLELRALRRSEAPPGAPP